MVPALSDGDPFQMPWGFQMEDMDDIIREFLLESYEGLDRLERDLLDYEKNPADPERLGVLFRVLHTLKGTGGFLGFKRLEKLSHGGENLLSLLRDGKRTMSPGLASLLLELVDLLRRGLGHIEAGDSEESTDDTAILERLKSATEMDVGAMAPFKGPDGNPPATHSSSQKPQGDAEPVGREGGTEESVLRVPVKLLDRLMDLTGEMVLARNQAHQLAEYRDDPAFNAVLQPMNQLVLGIQEGVMKARLPPLSQ